MQVEIEALRNTNTWSLVPLIADMKVVGCKWIFRIRYKADGSIDRYKAKLVENGLIKLLAWISMKLSVWL